MYLSYIFLLFNNCLSSSSGNLIIPKSSSCLGIITDKLFTLFSVGFSLFIYFLLLFPLLGLSYSIEGELESNLSFFLFKLSKPILFFLFLNPKFFLLEVAPLLGCSLSKYLLFSSLCILE